jgi:hypothetical protein
VLDVLRSRTAHTGVRRLSLPGSQPITLVRRLTSPSDPFEQVCIPYERAQMPPVTHDRPGA